MVYKLNIFEEYNSKVDMVEKNDK